MEILYNTKKYILKYLEKMEPILWGYVETIKKSIYTEKNAPEKVKKRHIPKYLPGVIKSEKPDENEKSNA